MAEEWGVSAARPPVHRARGRRHRHSLEARVFLRTFCLLRKSVSEVELVLGLGGALVGGI